MSEYNTLIYLKPPKQDAIYGLNIMLSLVSQSINKI